MKKSNATDHSESTESCEYEAPSFDIVDLTDTIGDSRGSGAAGGGGTFD